MRNFTVTLASILLLFSAGAHAQGFLPCGTSQANENALKKNPDAQHAGTEMQDHIQAFSESKKSLPPVYTIPVVFHVLHEYGSENISDAQIQDAVRILNEDYRRQNGDTINTVNAFRPIAADCEIEFRLAGLDPSGNCTNGIDRIVSSLTNTGDDDAKLNPWPRNKYLNIWVVKSIASGAAGYSMYPSSVAGGWGAAVDGIMILSNYVGSVGTGSYSRARALTHEVGHWLNLAHTWGDSNSPGLSTNCNDDDQVSDTPNTIGWTSCNLNGATCGSSLDNVQNYMEYSYCSNMFTQGQRSRMRAALTSNIAQRSSLWTSSNLNATGVNISPPAVCTPVADFNSDGISVCANSSIQFSDQSWNGSVTSWSWTFPGGNPSSSTSQNPVVVYSAPGNYAVTLSAGNSAGTDVITKTNYIRVYNSQSDIQTGSFSESFESITVPGSFWQVDNPSGGPAWSVISTTAFTGSKSARLYNLGSDVGDVDDLITPSFDLTQFTAPRLYYRYAYAQLPNSDPALNTLEIWVSDNCGKTWVRRKTLSGSALATTTATSTVYAPPAGNATQWKQDNISLSTFAADSNVRVMFRFIAGSGNNFYLDDININQPTGINDRNEPVESVTIYPNPLVDNSVIDFDLPESTNLTINILDVFGRQLVNIFDGNLAPGQHVVSLEAAKSFASGVYFIRVVSPKGEATYRFLKS